MSRDTSPSTTASQNPSTQIGWSRRGYLAIYLSPGLWAVEIVLFLLQAEWSRRLQASSAVEEQEEAPAVLNEVDKKANYPDRTD